jgi:uncharacterized protein (DUF1697 family)
MAKKVAAYRYVAFLRGINVGGHRVSMSDLADLFRGLKFANVATFIASGNVIFDAPAADAPALEGKIEGHLERSLGYAVDTFLRTPAELAAVAAYSPFASDGGEAAAHAVHVGFLREALSKEAGKKLLALRTAVDDFEVAGREMYWRCRVRVSDSPVSWPVVAKTLGVTSTMRNVTTVRKLAAKYPPA